MSYRQFLVIHTTLVNNTDRFASSFKIMSTSFLIEHKLNVVEHVSLFERWFDLFYF